MSRIRRVTLDHLKSLLESRQHPSAERILICQLLVDLETSFSTFTSDSENVHRQHDSSFATHQRDLAALLCETGDENGALTLLRRIPRAQIEKEDLERIMQLGTALCSRMTGILKILGIGDDSSTLDVSLDVLVLPYSLLAAHSRKWIDNEGFIKKSFIWPWIRRSIRAQLRDHPGAPVDWSPSRLDTQFRDVFGHSLLHAAIYSQDNDHIEAIIKDLNLGPEDVRAYLSTRWPFYAPGFTPLACCASFSLNWGLFNALLPFSNKSLCCGSINVASRHEFCALAIALRKRDNEIVGALFQRAFQERVDISNCCHWAMGSVPNISLEASEHLLFMIRQSMADAEEPLWGPEE
ncbi:hypothetical protein J7T55_004449 [Diaporthe amygdali]|uniref:uncharacterized protein n=1 Tax=Phomopsis amygdali TaxID=1214568 RepID=UPI0022FF35C1|nr:uncharacterized protein J7T55_004449 [Diaporthe amygdali]KAJ0109899.1 hypothetical protein J7T55_004449 [Diaporthe amygdali]